MWGNVKVLLNVFSSGGANQFADAFAVAERMRKEFPEEFDLLSTVKV